GALRPIDRLGSAVARSDHPEHVRLYHTLPECAELLVPGHGEHVEMSGVHGVHRARDEIRSMARVRIGEADEVTAGCLGTGRTRPWLAEPSVRQRRVLDQR